MQAKGHTRSGSLFKLHIQPSLNVKDKPLRKDEEIAIYDETDVLDAKGAARMLKCTRRTLYNYVDEGKIHEVSINKRKKLFFRSDIINYLKNNRGLRESI